MIYHLSHNLQQMAPVEVKSMQIPLLLTIINSEKSIATYLIVSVRLWNFFFGGSKIIMIFGKKINMKLLCFMKRRNAKGF